MKINFSESEKLLCRKFKNSLYFTMNGEKLKIILAGKPRPIDGKGEPKTDVFVLAKDKNGKVKELKISYKKENADFIGNKITKDTAEEIFGKSWKDKIKSYIEPIKSKFEKTKLIFKKERHPTKAGSITLGWRFELVNKPGGTLSTEIHLSDDELMAIYAGTNLPINKRNSWVNNQIFENSGVANYILVMDINQSTTIDDITNHMCKINDYIKKHRVVYAVFKAVNYRTLESKVEGRSRQLAVYIEWEIKHNKLHHNIIFDDPLAKTAGEILDKTISALKEWTIDDITKEKVDDPNILYQ